MENDYIKQGDDSNKPLLEEVIYPDIEPGIINRIMIENSFLQDAYRGEERRLHKMEPVVLDQITSIRLEFKNILRIDHLWIIPNLTKLSLNCNKIEVIENMEMLPALTELNLSFNYIEKIENLEKLVNLEVLSLFNNRIEKIENMDALEKLVILSLGCNLINTVAGIERFRFMTNLKVLNLEGNPVAKRTDFCLLLYVIAILPKLNYYEYTFIKNELREEACALFYNEIERHRSKILEINSFIEILTEAMALLPHDIREELAAEEYVV
ncbi:dynein regulatory complex subunit 3 isoform X2 [Drosophila pseudoobscura]|uniref:Dynein axonemal assembly factor 1 homolog n=1 Tax=Drosophila pseudoobscura pseudoobscura TaxID=46245 RepID=A0A6I8W3G8_DROPS|nr:dynein regulatory complex subunit 3 isoform X2 [Drosophila pseudoobscura]